MTLSASKRSLKVESFKVMDVLKRANELQAAGKHVLHCEIGQPKTGAPSNVTQAAIAALHGGATMGYTDAFGLIELREKIANHYVAKYKLMLPPSLGRIVITTGSSAAFLLAFTACFDAGDVVAIASSGYPCYRNILSALGCEQANIKINEEFKLTANELKTEIIRRMETKDKPIKGLILSSPSNPTGAMLTPEELKQLCETCDEHNIQFLSDEIYHGISYGKEEATAVQYSSSALVINSFSKYYSMSGWRLGWMILPEHLIDAVNSLQQNMFINAPTISQIAAIQCWNKSTIRELEGHVEQYKKSRELILDELSHIKEIDPKNIAPADGGFYVYVDLGDENVADGWGAVSMCQAVLEEEYVAFTPGNDFEDPETNLGDRRFRISYAGGVDTTREAMQRFHRFWPKWTERVRRAKLTVNEI